MASVWYCNHCGARFYSEAESRGHYRAEHARIPLYCNDCEADITADPLTHDCNERRARHARLAQAQRHRRRFLLAAFLLLTIAGIVAGIIREVIK